MIIRRGKPFPKAQPGCNRGFALREVKGQTALEKDQYGTFKSQPPSLPPHVHIRSFSVMEILQMRSSRGTSLEDANDNTSTRFHGRKEERQKRLLSVTL